MAGKVASSGRAWALCFSPKTDLPLPLTLAFSPGLQLGGGLPGPNSCLHLPRPFHVVHWQVLPNVQPYLRVLAEAVLRIGRYF